jgi:hypothetical protein
MRHTISSSLRFLAAAAAACLFASPQILYAADRAIPGRWEFTMTTDGVPHTSTICMSAEDAEQVNGDSTSGRAAAEKKAAGRCTVESFTAAGKSVDYTLICGPRKIHSTTIFRENASEGTLTTTADGKTISTLVKARRLGACT